MEHRSTRDVKKPRMYIRGSVGSHVLCHQCPIGGFFDRLLGFADAIDAIGVVAGEQERAIRGFGDIDRPGEDGLAVRAEGADDHLGAVGLAGDGIEEHAAPRGSRPSAVEFHEPWKATNMSPL